FLNRVDEIMLFHRLKRADMVRIVDIQMHHLTKLLEERKITVVLDPPAREWLAEKGWGPAYGAGPRQRGLPEGVQESAAEMILSGRIKDGDRVVISVGAHGLIFNGEEVAAAA